MAADWTPERIANLSLEKIKALRTNCEKNGAHSIVTICDEELAKRIPPRTRPSSATKRARRARRDPVVGYHFVCRPEEKGVARNADGTVWSGTWVVAEDQAKRSLSVGAYVALHLSHSEPSYLQGRMKDWRRSKRESEYAEGQEVKTPMGTDFLIELTDERLEWQGEGTVERSYVYASDALKSE